MGLDKTFQKMRLFHFLSSYQSCSWPYFVFCDKGLVSAWRKSSIHLITVLGTKGPWLFSTTGVKKVVIEFLPIESFHDKPVEDGRTRRS